MENQSAAQSRGSISSISTSTQTHDAHGTSNTNNHSEFVNHGFIRWNQIRQQWAGRKIPENQPKQLLEPKLRNSCLWGTELACDCEDQPSPFSAEPVCLPWCTLAVNFWNATYDSLLGSNKPFPKPIPLAEMVDFLVDVWEQDGMYD